MRPTRRVLLRGGLAAALWPLAGGAPAQAGSAVPPAADGFLILAAATARAQIAPPPAGLAETLAFADQTPGPLLRLRRGEDLKVRLVNQLTQPTALCFAGLRGPNATAGFGGLTAPPVAPGAVADIRFAPPDAGFNLYLPHGGPGDAEQQGRGLFGPIVVEEASPPPVDLDAAVILSDWKLDTQGRVVDDFSDPKLTQGAGRIGGAILANAAVAPLTLSARPGARLRLRLANAATARTMTLAVKGAKPLIVAVDGQPSEPFEPLRDQFPMGPQARFELVLDLPREAGADVRLILRGGDDQGPEDSDRPVVVVKGEGEPAAPRPPFPGLPANRLLPTEINLEAARRFEMTIAGGGPAPFAVNGSTFRDWGAKPLFAAPRGTPVTVAFVNKTAVVQAMRLHGHVARLLHALDDGWEPYWRDTLIVPPGKTARIAFVADNPGKWPLESATPEHRAAGVGGWFQVG